MILYTYMSVENDAQTQIVQHIERFDGTTIKIELRVDRSYIGQSSAKISHLTEGQFIEILHQYGPEVSLATYLHSLTPPQQGELQRNNKVEALYVKEIEKLIKLAWSIVC